MQSKEDLIATALRNHETFDTIAKKFHVSPKKICLINKSLSTNQDYRILKKPGRPSKMTPDVISFVQTSTSVNPLLGGKSLANQIAEKLNVKISYTLVNTIRELLKFKYTNPRHRPLLTEAQKEKRISFCTSALSGDLAWDSDVVISDESRFGLFDDSRRIWVQRGVYTDNTFSSVPKFSKSFIVWGDIGLNFKSELIFIEGNLIGEKYAKMQEDNRIITTMKVKFTDTDVHFQKDGAPALRKKQLPNGFKIRFPLLQTGLQIPLISV
jgi:transposase